MKKLLIGILFLASCARAPLEKPEEAFRLSQEKPVLSDSLSFESFREALRKTIVSFDSSAVIPTIYSFEQKVVSRENYKKFLLDIEKNVHSQDELIEFLSKNATIYEVYGSDEYGKIFSTGYYDPISKGSLRKTEKFSQAIYKTPPDLVVVDLGAYAEKFPDLEHLKNLITEQKSKNPQWRGRYIAEQKKVVPYYTREELYNLQPLANKKLELLYMDPIDAFFLEIQGSGLIDLGNKKVRVGYESQNGHPYFAIGKALLDKIPLEEMSMQKIREALSNMPREEQQSILNQNPSMVFFQTLKGESLTYSGAEVTAGRTIATDRYFFPKGLLAFLSIETPVFSDGNSHVPTHWESKPRFVFDQDTGGAIRGGGRVDLYMGMGEEAAQMAGVMKRDGRLWYFVPNETYLEQNLQLGLK
ncbi:MAG: MltA domain-containing protein [Oligoflexia bacterium]|nr:MltA domain-containing protein [Oligoflexia bacterium]